MLPIVTSQRRVRDILLPSPRLLVRRDGPAPAYSATKAMQNVYLQALDQQAHQRGLNIKFTDIRPGFVDTALLSGDFKYPMMLKPEQVAKDIMSAIKSEKHIVVIDWRYHLLTMFWRRIPRWIWRRFKL